MTNTSSDDKSLIDLIYCKAMRSLEVREAAADLLSAFANPMRIRMIRELQVGGEPSVNELSIRLGVSQSGLSHNLTLLRHLRVVTLRQEGNTRRYSINPDKAAIIGTILKETFEHVREQGLG